MTTIGIIWVAHPPSNSDHQNDYIFSRGSLNLHWPQLLGGGTTQGIMNDPLVEFFFAACGKECHALKIKGFLQRYEYEGCLQVCLNIK